MERESDTLLKISLPKEVKHIIDILTQNGYEAYAVGGCVRDSILGRVPGDWDITTSALPQQVKALFRRTIDTGIQHGTVTIMLGKNGYEVTTYRIDGKYEDSRHPESVEFTPNLEEDLKRRDFTINAMAYNDENGVVDVFGGIDDIRNRIIRCVGNAHDRFTEDALRILRAVRFSAQLGFEIDKATKDAARELETARQEIEAARAEVSELQAEKETLQGTVKELKAAKKVSLDLERIKPEETMMGNIKGVTLKEVKQLKALAVRGAEAEQTVKQQVNTIELQKAQITSLERQLRPSIQKRLKEAQELSDLKDENMALEYELNRQKDLMARLMQRVEAALTFLEEKLPEQFRPYVQRARAHIMPEPKQEHRHDRGMSMGGMSR